MNSKQLLLAGFIVVILFALNSCSDSEDDPDPCMNGPEISVDNVKVSIEGKATGEITVSATGGADPYMFSIDGSTFQTSGLFSNLAAGDYTLTVKDANECTDSEMVTVAEVPEVSYANQIRPIIDNNCQLSNCHGDRQGIPTFATYDNVKARAAAIKTKTGDKSMPPTGPLPDSEIKLIADWVDQGAPDN
ncbi:MAG: hypothetical protein MI975_00460 [Cytophagales bacterium]|nr:hypothetical protein [Cytophagales bacterium]